MGGIPFSEACDRMRAATEALRRHSVTVSVPRRPASTLRVRRRWFRPIRRGDMLVTAGRRWRVASALPDDRRHLLLVLEPLRPSPLDEVLERVAVRETAKGL